MSELWIVFVDQNPGLYSLPVSAVMHAITFDDEPCYNALDCIMQWAESS